MKNAVKAATLAILFMLFMPLVGHASSMPGDCNSDGYVDAGDVSALILEIFDGDGDFPEDTPGGIIPGDSVGSDANEDGVVDAGDVSCVMLLIFGGPGACHDTAAIISDIVLEIFDGDGDLAEDTPGGTFPGDPEFSDANVDGIVDAGDMTCAVLIDINGQEACSYGAASAESLYGAAQAEPTLVIPVQVPADAGGTVTVPVNYTSNGNAISSMIFSVDIDETNLDFNPESTMGFPWPDAITVNPLINPFVFSVGITYDANDTDGELDFTFSDINPPLSALPDGVLVTITFTAGNPAATTEAPVLFSLDPPASFGNTAGESVPGATIDGSVLITVQCTPTGVSETICNGIDDDCDDLIDEDFTPPATTCGIGVCASTGQIVCVDGQAMDTCRPGPQDEAADVTCDGLDGDCDGQADEDFQSTPTTCGVGACEGNTGQIECQDGSEIDTCDPLAGAAPADTTCNNVDDDCDGEVDEDFQTTPTTCGVGACEGNTGQVECQNGSEVDTCEPLAGALPEGPPGDGTCFDTVDNDCDGQTDLGDPDCEIVCTPTGTPETVCNGVDDDCDDLIDEDFTPEATTCGEGECAATGETSCVDGVEGDTCTAGTPSAEVCDNLDNDCDGSTDEELTRPTTCGVGECAGNTGEETCTAGTWGGDTCDPLAGATAETCDNLDNDCDGSTDEELTRATTCGVGECAGNTGEETCTAGTWGGDTCDPLAGSVPEGPPGDQTCGDTLDNDCDGLSDLDDPDCEVVCTPTGVPESECNGVDDDCDGAVDEDFQPTATTCGVGECASTGQTTCEGGVEGDTCTAGTPSAEVCDNLDNDCDGSTDEELTRATTCGVGECAGNTGEETCTAGTWGGDTCDPLAGSVPEGPPGDQTCGDTLDNDCDGLSDLDDPDCEVVCTPTGVPESECNGVDDDCDGAVDEDFQPTATTCGVGECASTGQTTCEGGVEGDTCTAGTPSAEVCDNLDNDCDGSIDEELTRPTTCGVGECAGNTGEETCTAGTWGGDTCDPLAGATAETCDNLDNDCDGSTDEELTRATTCGVGECAGNTGEETCTAGTWGGDTCDPLAGSVPEGPPGDQTCGDTLDNDCDGLSDLDDPDCEVVCTPTGVPESECNGIDDDCDGAVDEDFQPTATTCGVGECASTGQTTCEGGVEGDTCTAGTPVVEVCDNLDNDCDGSIDEELTRPTTCGVGECAGNTGEETCTAGTWGNDTCDPFAGAMPEGPPGDGTCSDTVDNDCDGFIDSGDSDCIVEMGGEGCTPGYWKQEQHFDSWNVFAPDMLFSDVFDDAFSGMTLLEVLDQNGDGLNSLGRHTVAALLNADSTSVEYDLTTTQVITMFNNAYPGSKDDYHVLKYVFEGFNKQVCPLN